MAKQTMPQLPRWDGPLSHPFYSKVVKRALDFLLALLMLIPGCIIMLPLAIWVKLDSPGPVIYKAVRGGYHNKPFLIYKFRSMVVDADKTGGCTALNDSRVTRAGRVMRKLKLDELPQLFNILKGQMSIVGPRPALWNQDDLVAERDKYGANDCVPGLTGYAQVHGRDELPIPVKAELDGYYAKNLSFALDVKIFFRTIGSVLHHEGVVEGKQDT